MHLWSWSKYCFSSSVLWLKQYLVKDNKRDERKRKWRIMFFLPQFLINADNCLSLLSLMFTRLEHLKRLWNWKERLADNNYNFPNIWLNLHNLHNVHTYTMYNVHCTFNLHRAQHWPIFHFSRAADVEKISNNWSNLFLGYMGKAQLFFRLYGKSTIIFGFKWEKHNYFWVYIGKAQWTQVSCPPQELPG